MNAPETSWQTESSLPSHTAPTVIRPLRTSNHTPRVLTLENAEGGVTLNVGQEFRLDLGLNWNVRVRDEAVLVSDGSGTFHALANGTTKIYATTELQKNDSSPPNVPRKILIEIPVTVL